MSPRSIAIFLILALLPGPSQVAWHFPAFDSDFTLRPAGLEESSPEVRTNFLKALATGLEEENPMDARITRAQELMEQGRVKEAAIELLETLEDLALDGGLKFTRWEEARELLMAADEAVDLKAVMGIKPSQTLRQHWFGEMQSGLEELPGEVARELGRWGDVESVSDPFLVLDANGLPLVTRVHRISLDLPSAQEPATRPLVLVQEGFLSSEVLKPLAEMGWQVNVLAQDVSEKALLAQVTDARSRWDGPVLVVVGPRFEGAVRGLSIRTQITGVILDRGFPPDLLISFLNQILTLPGRVFHLEYGIRSSLEESCAVSTQL